MPYAPHGIFGFPGVASILSGNFVLSPGISPGVCMLSVAPQPLWAPKVGTLAIDYSNIHLRFKDCTIDRVEQRTDSSGLTSWSVSILDRRWMWRGLGRISGYYNVRRETRSGHPLELVDGTERSPKALAKLCLQAMGETNYDVSAIPDRARPAIEWDYTTPSEALAKLCDSVDCLVTLTADDRAVICRKNVGQVLPYTPTVLSGGSEVDPAERPDSIVVVTAPSRVQQDLELEAVGMDVGYTIKPINDLSYMPSGGWFKSDLIGGEFLEIEDPTHRKLAAQSVFRQYRIKTPFNTLRNTTIDNIDRILPLLSQQILEQTIQGREEPRRPEVFGRFYEEDLVTLTDGAEDDEKPPSGIKPPDKHYEQAFSLDVLTGIVTFSAPVYRRIGIKTPKGWEAKGVASAALTLRVAFNVRDVDTRGWQRWELEANTEGSKAGTNPAYFRHDDLVPKYVEINGTWWNNAKKVRKQAEYYRDSHLDGYRTMTPQTYEYGGFVKLSPDGAISTVVWKLSAQGYATTRAVRGKDALLLTPTYAERRLWERIAEETRQAASTTTEQAQRQARGRA